MCFQRVRQFQNSEVTDQQEPFCVCIYYGITEFRCHVVGGGLYQCTVYNRVKGHVWGGTTIMPLIPGLRGQVVGGGTEIMPLILGVRGQVVGGYHNHATYSRIERPGCRRGTEITPLIPGVRGQVGEGTTIMPLIPGLRGQVVGGYRNHTTYSGSERPGWGDTAITPLIPGLIRNICKFLCRLVTEMKLRIPTGMAK